MKNKAEVKVINKQLIIRGTEKKYERGKLDLSRFDAAPLKGFTVTKETDYVTETDGRIPPRCSADYTDERADAETGS